MSFRRLSIFFSFSILFALNNLTAVPQYTRAMALQAEQMLSEQRWAEAVEIQNTNKTSRYPETVYATLFEFDNSLWFYTGTGTQPLIASKNRVEEFKTDLLALLQTVEDGFNSFALLDSFSEKLSELPQLPNGCVIESIFSFKSVQQKGAPILSAKLLLYTSSKNSRRGTMGNAVGHCVLIYETSEGMFFVDPPEIGVSGAIRKTESWDPVQIAHEIESTYGKVNIDKAFFVPFSSSNNPVLALAN